jgi:hypothetical protein
VLYDTACTSTICLCTVDFLTLDFNLQACDGLTYGKVGHKTAWSMGVTHSHEDYPSKV